MGSVSRGEVSLPSVVTTEEENSILIQLQFFSNFMISPSCRSTICIKAA